MTNDFNDCGWTLRHDQLSCSVGINVRIRICKQQKKKPVLIRLGKKATMQFFKEYRLTKETLTTPYYYADIEVKFFDDKIIGIAVEGE